MSINVVTFSTRRTSGSQWRNADHDAHDFVQAHKGRTICEYSWLEVRGEWHRFDNTTRPQVITWFGLMACGPSPFTSIVSTRRGTAML